MIDLLSFHVSTWAYIPHGHCYLWQLPLIWLHALSDSLIAIAYYSIPLMLAYFVRKRPEIQFKGTVWLFSAFILSCGTTHVLEIWTLWHPAYWLSGGLKAITAIVSCVTAIDLVTVIPQALSMPSREDLEASNQTLQQEIHKREQVERQLNHRLEFGQLLAQQSSRFINLDSSNLSMGIDQSLEQLAAFIGVEHSYVFKVFPEEETFSLTHEWTAYPIPPEGTQHIPYAVFPWAIAQLQEGNVINIPRVEEMGESQSIDQASWRQFDVKSVLCIPLRIQSRFFGWIGVSSHTREHQWMEVDVQCLIQIGEMLTNALNREQVESERAKVQEQLEDVFVRSPGLNCIAGLDGYFKVISPSFSQLLGFSTEDLLSQPFIDFVHPDDRGATTSEVERLAMGALTIDFENRYRMLDGTYKWISWYASANLDVKNIYATAVDVSERKQVQLDLAQKNRSLKLLSELSLQIRESRQIDEVLKQTAKSLQLFLETSRVLVLQLTPEGCIVKAESVLPGESHIIGHSFLDPCFATDYVNKYQDGQPSMMEDVSTANIQDCHRELLQNLRVKSNLIAPIFLQNQIWGLLVAHQCDTTRSWLSLEVDLLQQVADQISIGLAQWQLLTQLEAVVDERTAAFLRSESQFRSLFEAAPDLIYILNVEGQIQTVNPAVSESLGYDNSELVHQALANLLTPESQTTCSQEFEDLMTQGVHRQEMNLYRKDGTVLTVDCACKLVNAEDNPFILVLQRDISQQKAVESMKDEFVSVVSHELRTPLTSIHGSLKLLNTGNLGDLSAQGAQVLDIALRNTERLGRLINDVLDLERIESGKVVMSRQYCVATDLMTQAIQDMDSMAQQRQVQLITSPLDRGVFADPDHILQTLTNLLSNAIKFSESGHQVWLSATEREEEIRFEVKDEGRGIPRNKIETIFERFQQVDVSDARKMGGTGLGLAICQQIIERHGGRIWVVSTEGQGSSFYFTLPKSTFRS